MTEYSLTREKAVGTLKSFLQIPPQDAGPVFKRFRRLKGSKTYGRGLQRFLYIPGTRDDRILLVAHADTVWDKRVSPSYSGACSELVCTYKEIRREAGFTGLGADDRAGCAIVWMLKGLGHSILITDGEEFQRQGSTWLMEEHPELAAHINDSHGFSLQFDLKEGGYYKSYTVGTTSFREYIENMTGFEELPPTGGTDIITICKKNPGANLSVGYRHAHTTSEYIDINQWLYTLEICRKWLSQPGMPKYELI